MDGTHNGELPTKESPLPGVGGGWGRQRIYDDHLTERQEGKIPLFSTPGVFFRFSSESKRSVAFHPPPHGGNKSAGNARFYLYCGCSFSGMVDPNVQQKIGMFISRVSEAPSQRRIHLYRHAERKLYLYFPIYVCKNSYAYFF
ncbi:hypothetical protein CEXT_808281 [Caerostris extrusa]|uniref:Uncharacterized protein n=1 Tax=Caerostris extrusa TaxID=172846 RepID=A0AAV4N9L7_CAEEX|nr:hypothetical protein CEXT_808281 [Caerostris extrusa]